jgi:hypothetical protein
MDLLDGGEEEGFHEVEQDLSGEDVERLLSGTVWWLVTVM